MKADFQRSVLRARMSCEASALVLTHALDMRVRAAATRDYSRFLRAQAAEIRAERPERPAGPAEQAHW